MAIERETVETLEAAALQLTPGERSRLVDRLIATLDRRGSVGSRSGARQNEIENGTVSLLPGPESLTKLEAAFE